MRKHVTGAERVYAALLRLTPAELRHEAAAEMLSIFRDGHRAARHSGRSLALPRFWISTLRDLWRVTRDQRSSAARLHHRTYFDSPDGAQMFVLLLKDLRFAARSLVRSPGFSIVILLTLALEISAIVQIRCIPELTY